MNPNREGPQLNFELPAQPPSPETGDQKQEKGAEAPAAPAEQAGKQAPAPALPVVPDIPVADAPVIAVPVHDDTTSGFPAADHTAQDLERIEPIWVDKAKAIISQTREDPYMQKTEMSRVKAEYIQKRFNKQIKTDDAKA
jgi:hypothetical protein